MDIERVLKQSGEPVAETCFPGETSLPFIVFLEECETQGGDMVALFKVRSITVERYSLDGRGGEKLEALVKGLTPKYSKSKAYLSSEQCYMEVYEFELTERV